MKTVTLGVQLGAVQCLSSSCLRSYLRYAELVQLLIGVEPSYGFARSNLRAPLGLCLDQNKSSVMAVVSTPRLLQDVCHMLLVYYVTTFVFFPEIL